LKILVFVGTKGFNYENNLEYMKFLDSLKIPYKRLIVPDAPHSARIIYDKRGMEIMQFHAENFRKALGNSPAGRGKSNKKKKKRNAAALPKGVKVLKDIKYAKVGDISLKLDLYQPPKSETKAALIVWIHGGAWSKGSKNRCPIAWITAHGFAIASVDYRLSGTAKFPALVHDCKGAIRWLRANADRYGYAAERIGVAGSSAGGHLAALVGTSGDVKALEGDVGGHLDQSSRVHAIVDMFGPTDLFHNATVEKERCDKPDCPLFQLLGGKPSERTDAARLASPVHNVTPDDPPIIILHGTEDKSLVKTFQGRFLHEKYLKAGLQSTFQVIEGAGHGGPQYSDAERRKLILCLFDTNVKHRPAS
jgi:acetyl esterase/lipase